MKNCCEIGSHKCSVALEVPNNVKIYKVWFDERKYTVSVDKCLVPAIKALWAAGIPTVNSCCGHGILPVSILLGYRYIDEVRKESVWN